KDFMNRTVMALPQGQEKLIDIKIFRINILMVWLAFAVFGALSFIILGFGLLIIIFSILNCITLIAENFKHKS
ncbi:HXXEE domain-containing protein, partial [Francisella tularensis subsp. holarctica]|nr:HXXEE domain-containing protein [Francisella tularensis subsp. holarctica]